MDRPGGPVKPGNYVVGKGGPEMFVPIRESIVIKLKIKALRRTMLRAHLFALILRFAVFVCPFRVDVETV